MKALRKYIVFISGVRELSLENGFLSSQRSYRSAFEIHDFDDYNISGTITTTETSFVLVWPSGYFVSVFLRTTSAYASWHMSLSFITYLHSQWYKWPAHVMPSMSCGSSHNTMLQTVNFLTCNLNFWDINSWVCSTSGIVGSTYFIGQGINLVAGTTWREYCFWGGQSFFPTQPVVRFILTCRIGLRLDTISHSYADISLLLVCLSCTQMWHKVPCLALSSTSFTQLIFKNLPDCSRLVQICMKTIHSFVVLSSLWMLLTWLPDPSILWKPGCHQIYFDFDKTQFIF